MIFLTFSITVLILIGFPDPILMICPLVFLLNKVLIIAFTMSSIWVKSLNCLPSEHANFFLLRQDFMIMGKNLLKSCFGP